MKNSLLKRYIAIVGLGLPLLFFWQNCGQGLQSEDFASISPSPFDNVSDATGAAIKDNRFQFSHRFQKRLEESTLKIRGIAKGSANAKASLSEMTLDTVISKDESFDLIISETCLVARQNKTVTNKVRYSIDSFVGTKIKAGEISDFQNIAVELKLPRDMTFRQLKQVVRADDCIIGISDGQMYTLKTSQVSDPSLSMQKHLTNHQFLKNAEAFWKATSGVPITVAIMDSGIDKNAKEVPEISPFSQGANLSEMNDPSNYQDLNGHGTTVANIIAGRKDNQIGGTGIFPGIQILPLKLTYKETGVLSSIDWFNAFRYAVNAKADVINMSLAGISKDGEGCPAVIGHAIYRSIERGTFVVVAAGHDVDPLLPGDQSGAVISPRDNGSISFQPMVLPACWGRYFKGMLTVSALDNEGQSIASFSNWGAPGVEIAATGTDIVSSSIDDKQVVVSGTSFATPQVTAAVALTIAYAKKKGWQYSPWQIEDFILNGSRVMDAVAENSVKPIRRGKVLDFDVLYKYLENLSTKTDLERKMEPTDNPEILGSGTVLGNNNQIIRLEVYGKSSFISIKDRLQLNAVAYYSDGSAKVVTEEVQWTQGPGYKITNQGVMIPSAEGGYTVEGKLQWQSAKFQLNVVSSDVITGARSEVARLDLTVNENYGCCIESLSVMGFILKAIYEDGSVRDVTSEGTFVPIESGTDFVSSGGNLMYGNQALMGKSYKFVAYYRGYKAELTLPMPIYEIETKLPQIIIRTSDSPQITRLIAGNPGYRLDCFLDVDTPMGVKSGRCNDVNLYRQVSGNWEFVKSGLRSIEDSLRGALEPGKYKISGQVSAKKMASDGSIVVVKSKMHELFIDVENIALTKLTVNFAVNSAETYYKEGSTFKFGFSLEGVFANGDKNVYPCDDLNFDIKSPNGDSRPLSFVNCGTSGGSLYTYDGGWGDELDIEVVSKKYPTVKDRVKLRIPIRKDVSPVSYTGPTQAVVWDLKTEDSVCSISNKSKSPAASGDGKKVSPFLICTVDQFIAVGKIAASIYQPGGVFTKLMNNMDFSGRDLGQINIRFNHFDGNGYTIHNLFHIDAEKRFQLFESYEIVQNVQFKDINLRFRHGSIFSSYGAKNVIFNNVSLQSEGSASLIEPSAGNNRLDFESINASNIRITGKGENLGGLIHRFTGDVKVENSYFEGNIISEGFSLGSIGGIFSGNDFYKVEIYNSMSKGTIRASTKTQSIFVGGITGSVGYQSKIVGNISEMEIYAQSGSVGGIVGKCVLWGSVVANDFKGKLQSSLSEPVYSGGAGGIVGSATDCDVDHNTMSGTTSDPYLGGILGRAGFYSRIRNNEIKGDVLGNQAGKVIGIADFILETKNFDAYERHIPARIPGNVFRGNSSSLPEVGFRKMLKSAAVDPISTTTTQVRQLASVTTTTTTIPIASPTTTTTTQALRPVVTTTTTTTVTGPSPAELVTAQKRWQQTLLREALSFNNKEYLLMYPDVADAVKKGQFASGYDHYKMYGCKENRSPSLLFNEFALQQDFKSLVSKGQSAWQTYSTVNAPLWSDVNLEKYSHLDETLYLKQNPDVAEAVRKGSYRSGLEHFVAFGRHENRSIPVKNIVITPAKSLSGEHLKLIFTSEAKVFNEAEYLAMYPDVADAVKKGYFKYGQDHYRAYGFREGRSPSLLFDEKAIKLQYAKQIGSSSAWDYFVKNSPNSFLVNFDIFNHLDEKAYLNAYPDVLHAINEGKLNSALEHYVRFGRSEKRRIFVKGVK